MSKLDQPVCHICNKSDDVNYFIEVPILSQLETLYKRPDFIEKLNSRFHRNKKNDLNYEDIYDGSVYKSLPERFLSNRNNVTFSWNSDGVPLFKSSKFNIWPFYLVINELSFKERFSKDNVIVAGLWFGSSKPSINLFASVFENDLKKLVKGVDFKVGNEQQTIKVKALISSGTCDLPAKALFLNLQQFNGKHGCPHCEIETKRIENTQTYPFKENLILRTSETTNQYSEQALQTGKPVRGVKGPTFLKLIVFDFQKATGIDSMHNLDQGLMKKLMTIWFDVDHRNHASSLLPYISIIDKQMKLLTPPAFVNRLPRKVSEYSYWKASEFRSFLLIYSIPLLKNIMNSTYFEHHALLVYAIFLLNCTSISNEMIETAKHLLIEYVSKFECL